MICKKRIRKLGLSSLDEGLRGEQVLSSNVIEGPELYFPSMHSKRMRSYSHEVQEEKFQLDTGKKNSQLKWLGSGIGCPESAGKGPEQSHLTLRLVHL